MKQSFIALLTVYVPMFGVPILLLSYVALYFSSFQLIRQVVLDLAMIGLLVFAVSGINDIYLVKAPKNAIKIKTKLTEPSKTAPVQKTEGTNIKTVRFRIKRFNPKTTMLEEQVYDLQTNKFSTVLDGLIDIKHFDDPTLAIRYSCRMGICGSCGMIINGKPSLACETHVWSNTKNDSIEVSPMLGHPLLKDLVTDFDDFFEKHVAVNPYLFRKDLGEKYHPTKEYPQTREELDKFLPFSYCIMCGLCVDACPVVNTNPEFVGPQALSQAYRYHADSRDEAGASRFGDVDLLKGVWDCEFAGSCSEVCPKGVDPAFAIQLLKTEIIKNDFENKK